MRGVILHSDASGYQARLVDANECEWTGELVIDVIRTGPDLGDAGLLARSRAIDWAREIGERWIEDSL